MTGELSAHSMYAHLDTSKVCFGTEEWLEFEKIQNR